MSPVFRHGGLRLYLLGLLAESPRHGYEVIVELENRFLGTYAPSAGTIYPRLAKLEAEGLVEHHEVEGRKVYAITEAGRAELEAHRDELDSVEQEVRESVARVAEQLRRDVGASARDLREELTAAARGARRERRASGRSARADVKLDEQEAKAFDRDLAALLKRAARAVQRTDPDRVRRVRDLVRRLDDELTAILDERP
ncbi:PadR family transcriptional regulator [Jatrophihabitans sp. YIM 134969]